MTAAPVLHTHQRSVQVGARQIHLSEFGAGPALLMLHGGGPGASGVSNYAHNIQALAQSFRVLVPDLPGYGLSGPMRDGVAYVGHVTPPNGTTIIERVVKPVARSALGSNRESREASSIRTISPAYYGKKWSAPILSSKTSKSSLLGPVSCLMPDI